MRQASGDPVLAQGFGHLRLSAPATYANLTVYTVTRNAPAPAPLRLASMDAAMSNRVLSVVEPSLSVTNIGPQPTYIPGGEVVPGGNQDQAVGVDAIIPAHSPAVDVASFCVEANRSDGPSPAFNADVAFAIPAVRRALQVDADQEEVWNTVADATDHFDARTGTGTYHALVISPSARAASLPYVQALAAPAAPGPVVGAVVVINGKIICADIYHDPALFQQLWPALLRSYALQAAMCPPGGVTATPDPAQWLQSLDAAPGAQNSRASGTEAARVAQPGGAGTRTAATFGPKALLHEAFWTLDAALPHQ